MRRSACVQRTDSLARVSRDLAAALDTLHISGTPTVLANGKLLPLRSEAGRAQEHD